MKSDLLLRLSLAAGMALLAACSEIGYCVQCISGHADVMSRRRPIAEVLHDPGIPEAERQQLARVHAIRTFAVEELALPDNESYRLYADIGRPYVVWNVVATPEFSLSPRQWCYPLIGCVAYRGYFKQAEAQAQAAELSRQGYDVDLYGVKAYSTLKWFDDPVLNTFLDGNESQVASLIFHELAHQVVYVPDDCAFNEAFAKTVELEGLRRWLRARSDEAAWQDHLLREQLGNEFLALLSQAREKLADLYARPLSDEEKRAGKQELLLRLEATLRRQGAGWPDPGAIDRWLERGLNNARLASIATYQDQVPALQALLASRGGDLAAFYAEAGRLAALPAETRRAELERYGIDVMKTACVQPRETSR